MWDKLGVFHRSLCRVTHRLAGGRDHLKACFSGRHQPPPPALPGGGAGPDPRWGPSSSQAVLEASPLEERQKPLSSCPGSVSCDVRHCVAWMRPWLGQLRFRARQLSSLRVPRHAVMIPASLRPLGYARGLAPVRRSYPYSVSA